MSRCILALLDPASSHFTTAMVSFHLITMFILLMAAVVAWGKAGSGLLVDNWHSALGGKSVARAIFDGVCIAFVGEHSMLLLSAFAMLITPYSPRLHGN